MRPFTYDFFNWLTHVRLLGATEIAFNVEQMGQGKWPFPESMKRFRNYMWPGCALAGLPCAMKRVGDRKIGSILINDLLADLGDRDLPRLKTVKPPGTVRYTVTLRETFHNPRKNSDRKLWLAFAQQIGAHVIEDYERKNIALHDRVALCAGATMNFGVTNGPMSLLYYTEYPFRIFCDPATTIKSFSGHKIKVGDQLPIFLPTQRLVWKRPTMDDLMQEMELALG